MGDLDDIRKRLRDGMPQSFQVPIAVTCALDSVARELDALLYILRLQDQKIQDLETQILFLRQGKDIIT